MRRAPQPKLFSHGAVQSVVCHQDLTSKPMVAPLKVIICPLRASSHCKHDMGTLSWLNVEALKRVPTSLFGGLVWCSTHGRSKLFPHGAVQSVVCHQDLTSKPMVAPL